MKIDPWDWIVAEQLRARFSPPSEQTLKEDKSLSDDNMSLFSSFQRLKVYIWQVLLKHLALLGNYDRQTNKPTDHPTNQTTDGHEGSNGS